MGKIDDLRQKLGLPISSASPRSVFNSTQMGSSGSLKTQLPSRGEHVSETERTLSVSRLSPSPLFIALASIDLCTIDPIMFEKLTMAIFETFGFKGRITPASGDHGIDIVLENPFGKIFCVQCKRYASGQLVSPREVREFLGAMTYIRASEGYFVTTSRFSAQCCEFARNFPLHLIDKAVLNNLLASAESLYREAHNEIINAPEDAIRKYLLPVVPYALEEGNAIKDVMCEQATPPDRDKGFNR